MSGEGRVVTLDRADVEQLLWIVPNAHGHRHRALWERIDAALREQTDVTAPASIDASPAPPSGGSRSETAERPTDNAPSRGGL